MPTTRSQKNNVNIAAETLMSIRNDNDILRDMLSQGTRPIPRDMLSQDTRPIPQDMLSQGTIPTVMNKAKEELNKLKLIKGHTTNYNTLKMLVDIHTREMDRLELIISTLLSSVDK